MKKLLCAALLAASAFASPAMAATNFSFTGTFDDPNDVQLFNFTVGTGSTVTLRTYSYAGGTNAAGQVITGGNFDPILALFNSAGEFIDQNDDGGCGNVPPGNTGNCYDTYLNIDLAPGTYTVSVMAFSNFAVGPNLSNGFEGDGSFNGRGQNWAFDVLNVDTAEIPGVPEPATWAMMIGGFGLVGAAMRRRVSNVAYA